MIQRKRIHRNRGLARRIGSLLGAGLAAATAGAGADTIKLLDGQVVDGDVLKSTMRSIWVDLGYTVLEIPRDKIESIIETEGREAALQTSRDIFFVGQDLPERSPEEHARRIGEAIVKVSTPSGLGSGFIINPSGLVVTNAHVIQGETKIKCTVWFQEADGSVRRETLDDVRIVAVNHHLDLALLELAPVEGETFTHVPIQPSEELRVGQEVFAIGNPMGLERSLSQGVVSTTQRNFDGISYIQTTAEINPGNSGGPLLNSRGEVIGVTNMGYTFSEGLNFAIPARYVRDFLRNRDAFAYDKDNPNSGHVYHEPPPRQREGTAPQLQDGTSAEGG